MNNKLMLDGNELRKAVQDSAKHPFAQILSDFVAGCRAEAAEANTTASIEVFDMENWQLNELREFVASRCQNMTVTITYDRRKNAFLTGEW